MRMLVLICSALLATSCGAAESSGLTGDVTTTTAADTAATAFDAATATADAGPDADLTEVVAAEATDADASPETTKAPEIATDALSGCGDGTCSSSENCATCPADCSPNVAGAGADPCAEVPPLERCEEVHTTGRVTQVAGASGYWLGYFTVAADTGAVSGHELWVLRPNAAWVAAGTGAECQVAWAITGHVAEPGACASCDEGLAIEGTLDASLSTCPADLVKSLDATYSVSYDVRALVDANIELRFATSGKVLAQGARGDGWLTYRSAGQCAWF